MSRLTLYRPTACSKQLYQRRTVASLISPEFSIAAGEHEGAQIQIEFGSPRAKFETTNRLASKPTRFGDSQIQKPQFGTTARKAMHWLSRTNRSSFRFQPAAARRQADHDTFAQLDQAPAARPRQ